MAKKKKNNSYGARELHRYKKAATTALSALEIPFVDSFQITDKTSVGDFLNYINEVWAEQKEAVAHVKEILDES